MASTRAKYIATKKRERAQRHNVYKFCVVGSLLLSSFIQSEKYIKPSITIQVFRNRFP
jgi:hypothetical protein